MPKIKRQYETIDEIEDTYRPLYAEKDGKQVLAVDIDGLVPSTKLEEMRLGNIKDRQRFEDELAKFKDVDPDEYRSLKGRSKELEEHKLIKKGDLDTVVKSKVDEATAGFREKEREFMTRESQLKSKLSAAILESQVVEQAHPLGLRKGAAKDLIRRAQEMFRVDDNGDVIAYEADGKTPKYHLGDPYSIENFVKDTSKADDGKHLFEDNRGGGGDPGKASGAFVDQGINPWDPQTKNMSKQNEILVKNRPLAIRLAAKHNVTINPLPYGAAAR